jgi:hypothetical protein
MELLVDAGPYNAEQKAVAASSSCVALAAPAVRSPQRSTRRDTGPPPGRLLVSGSRAKRRLREIAG